MNYYTHKIIFSNINFSFGVDFISERGIIVSEQRKQKQKGGMHYDGDYIKIVQTFAR